MGAVSERAGRAARRRARRLPPPLPQRDGLDAVRWHIPQENGDPRPAREALLERFPPLAEPAATPLEERFGRGEIVDAHGRAWGADAVVGPGDELWFHREVREERVPEVELPILHRDEHLLVLDKPHDMATIPRGAHVLSSALVRLRRSTGISTLVPLHRLDRRTAGVLAFGLVPEERSAYQKLFARAAVTKVYEARVRPEPGASIPTAVGEQATLLDHLVKNHGELRAQVLPGEPNARTLLEVAGLEGDGAMLLRLHPRTGRTHQLRLQLSSRGAPILGEDLYPQPVQAAEGSPLQLLARSLAFTDPLTGQERHFVSARTLEGPEQHEVQQPEVRRSL